TSYSEGGSWLIKTDPEGNKLWDKIFDDGNTTFIQQTNNHGYILNVIAFVNNTLDMLLIKIDANGNLIS
ncbi:MAG TPA: hypothetical protein HA232_02990, partial [Methanocellales archaeon]|nr:hypothetical protein [Methanocellales archaeon]